MALDLPVQSDSALLLVRRQQRSQVHDLLQAGSRLNRTSFAGFERSDGIAIASVLEQNYVNALLDHGLDLLDDLVGVVTDAQVDANPFVVQVQLLVQGDLQLQLSRAQHKVLADNGTRLLARLGRSVLDLTDSQRNRATAMSAIGFRLAGKDLDKVRNSARFTLIVLALLQSDRGWCVRRNVESERESVRSELLQQTLLQLGLLLVGLFRLRVDLLGCQVQLLLEVKTHDLILLASIAEAADNLAKDLTVVPDVLIVEHDNAIW